MRAHSSSRWAALVVTTAGIVPAVLASPGPLAASAHAASRPCPTQAYQRTSHGTLVPATLRYEVNAARRRVTVVFSFRAPDGHLAQRPVVLRLSRSGRVRLRLRVPRRRGRGIVAWTQRCRPPLAPVPNRAPPPPAPPAPGPPAGASTSGVQLGVVGGTTGLDLGALYNNDLAILNKVGASLVRIEKPITATPDELRSVVAVHAGQGKRLVLLLGYGAGGYPDPSVCANVGAVARTLAGSLAAIEIGNEDSYSYKANNANPAAYARLYDACRRQAAGTGVPILAQFDDANRGPGWWDGLFAAVPGLRADGWVVHAYQPDFAQKIQRHLDYLAGKGASAPLWLTEFGFATDDGRCLSDNYGWNKCMSYVEAAQRVREYVGTLRTRFAGQVAAATLYHAADKDPAGASSNREEFFGITKVDGSDKGPYTQAVRELIAGR